MQGQKAARIQVDIDMLSTADKKKWSRPPINVFFEVLLCMVIAIISPNHTACMNTGPVCVLGPERQVPQDCGVQAWVCATAIDAQPNISPLLPCHRYDDSTTLKWVRYISKSGQYEIRY